MKLAHLRRGWSEHSWTAQALPLPKQCVYLYLSLHHRTCGTLPIPSGLIVLHNCALTLWINWDEVISKRSEERRLSTLTPPVESRRADAAKSFKVNRARTVALWKIWKFAKSENPSDPLFDPIVNVQLPVCSVCMRASSNGKVLIRFRFEANWIQCNWLRQTSRARIILAKLLAITR